MEYFLIFLIMIAVIGIVAWRWVEGIDYMHKNHPDYKGEDFLNWGEESAPWENKKDEK